jgi:hypothetical protein
VCGWRVLLWPKGLRSSMKGNPLPLLEKVEQNPLLGKVEQNSIDLE